MTLTIDSKLGTARESGLVVRPKPYPDEWLEGFVQRVITANGLSCSFDPGVDLDLRAACANLLDDHQRRDHSVGFPSAPGQFGTHSVPATLLLGVRSRCRICPGCIRERRYVRMIWRCARFDVCPRHRQRLLTDCPGCGVRLGLFHAVDAKCSCGWSVEEDNESWAASEPAVELAAVVWGPLIGAGANATPEAFASAFFASDFISRLMRRRRGRDLAFGDMTGTEYASRWLEVADLRLSTGVDGITSMLSGLKEPIHLAFAADYLDRIRRSELNQGTVLSSLPLAQWQELVAAAGAPGRRSRLMGTPVALARQRGLVTYPEIARAIGVPYWLVPREVEAAGLTPITLVRARRTYKYLTQEQLQALRSTARLGTSGISTRALGLDKTGSRQIQSSGVLRPVSPDARGVLRRDDWIQLDSDLRASAVSGTIVNHAVRLSERRFWEWAHGDALRTVIDDIRRGRHRLFVDPRASGLAAYLVGPEVVWELRRLSSFRKSKLAHDGQHELFGRPASS